MNNRELCEKLLDIHDRLSESLYNLASIDEWDWMIAREDLDRNLLKLEELIDEIDEENPNDEL